jgi:hypothetical protein
MNVGKCVKDTTITTTKYSGFSTGPRGNCGTEPTLFPPKRLLACCIGKDRVGEKTNRLEACSDCVVPLIVIILLLFHRKL